jgi:hypothetical protein
MQDVLLAIAMIISGPRLDLPPAEIQSRFAATCVDGKWEAQCPALRTEIEVALYGELRALGLGREPLDRDVVLTAVRGRFPPLADLGLRRLEKIQSPEEREAVLAAIEHPSPAVRVFARRLLDQQDDSWSKAHGRWWADAGRSGWDALVPDPVPPAIVYDMGGKFDKSFNEAAFNGAEQFKPRPASSTASSRFPERRPARAGAAPLRQDGQPADRHGRLRQARRSRRSPRNSRHQVRHHRHGRRPAERALIVFKEHEGSYLVGMLAAMASKTGKVGFVGGMDIPLIRKFACGYVAGRQGANPDRGDPEHDRHHGAAWNDPVQGRRTRQVAVRPRRGRRLRTRPAAPGSACCRPPTPASSASASTPTRTTCIRARC